MPKTRAAMFAERGRIVLEKLGPWVAGGKEGERAIAGAITS